MKFMLLTYLDEKAWFGQSEAERERIVASCTPHVERLIADGKFLAGSPLHPASEGATVRLRDGKRLVTDGPFAEAREQVAGYTLIEAQDRDEAMAIAAGFVGPGGEASIEVREVAEDPRFPCK